MTSDTIRIGIIGAGANTRDRHIPGLQAIAGVKLVGVCNRSRQSSQTVADQFHMERIYDQWTDVIADASLDAVVIGTWPYLHEPATVAALNAGKHVMCEARMARNATEAQQMLRAAQANPHLVTQLVPSPFTLHVDDTIQRWIRTGALGDLLAIDIRQTTGQFVNPDAPLTWRQDVDLNGMNIMMMGVWYEALMRWVGEATNVMAMGKVAVPMRLDPEQNIMRPVRVPDHINIVATMACGAQLSMMFSAVAGLHAQNSVYLYGTHGTLAILDGKLYGGRHDTPTLREITPETSEGSSWRVEEEFINAIRGLEPIRLTTFETGMKYMTFTEAVTRSMQTGKVVPLPL